jgi:hypothetical protein
VSDDRNKGQQSAPFADMLDAAIRTAPTNTVKHLLETVRDIYPAMTNRASMQSETGDNGPPPGP